MIVHPAFHDRSRPFTVVRPPVAEDHTLGSRCIVVLEDVESVFKAETSSNVAADRERQEREHEQTARLMEVQERSSCLVMSPSEAGARFSLQAQQAQSGKTGGGNTAAAAAALAHQYGVTIEDFIALVSGMLNPPAGR